MKRVRRIPALPRRRREGHKGDYGRVLVLAGSRDMVGAAALAGRAALRAGAGLVTIGTPTGVHSALAAQVTCCTTHPFLGTRAATLSDRGKGQIAAYAEGFDVIAVGPGLGRHPATTRLVLWLAARIQKPLVMDADALNALAEKPSVLKRAHAPRIVTPHPGEMARLLKFKSAEKVQADRMAAAARFAAKHRAIVVLKGNKSIVTDGERVFVNSTGNPGMASGGTGDVLTGVIAALIGQGLDPFDAAQLGVYVHGLAGDLAAAEVGQVSLIATDVLKRLPHAFKKISQ